METAAPHSPTEEFIDFTSSSPWERLIHRIESKLVEWGVGRDPVILMKGQEHHEHVSGVLKAHFEYRGSFVVLSYHCYPEIHDDSVQSMSEFSHFPLQTRTLAVPTFDFDVPPHPLCQWFGVYRFLVLEPARLSGADTSETALLLGSLSLAVSDCAPGIPCFTPLGEGYKGVVVGHATSETSYTSFESQRYTHIPQSLMYLPGLVDVFKSKMALPVHSAHISVASRFTYERNESQLHSIALEENRQGGGHEHARALLNLSLSGEGVGGGGRVNEVAVDWGATHYPVESLVLRCVWPPRNEDGITDNAVHSDFNPFRAPKLSIGAKFRVSETSDGPQTVLSEYVNYLSLSSISAQCELEQERERVRTKNSVASASVHSTSAPSSLSSAIPDTIDMAIGGADGLRQATASLLSQVTTAFSGVGVGGGGGGSETDGMDSTVLRRIMSIVFNEWDSDPRTGRFVPCSSILERLAWLMASQTKFNVMAVLWREFVRTIRWHWDNNRVIYDRSVGDGEGEGEGEGVEERNVNHGDVLLVQKLRLLNTCIRRKKKQEHMLHRKKQSEKENPFKKLLDGVLSSSNAYIHVEDSVGEGGDEGGSGSGGGGGGGGVSNLIRDLIMLGREQENKGGGGGGGESGGRKEKEKGRQRGKMEKEKEKDKEKEVEDGWNDDAFNETLANELGVGVGGVSAGVGAGAVSVLALDGKVKPTGWAEKVKAVTSASVKRVESSEGEEEEEEEEEEFFDTVETIDGEGEGDGDGIHYTLNIRSKTTDRKLNVPYTQSVPLPTSDSIQEHIDILNALQDSDMPATETALAQAKMYWAPLLSDMEAFKAANPGCCLVDFVRWHSPKDYIGEGEGEGEGEGGGLSRRMSEAGNIWQRLWSISECVPASEQESLFDFVKEAERIIDYFEHTSPDILFHQLQCIALRSALHFLQNTSPVRLSTTPIVCIERALSHLDQVIAKHEGASGEEWLDTEVACVHALETAELFIHRAIVLIRLWPGIWGMTGKILEHDEVLISDLAQHERATARNTVLKCFFSYSTGEKAGKAGRDTPTTREYVLRCSGPRPFVSSPPVPHRLYVALGEKESRVCVGVSSWDC